MNADFADIFIRIIAILIALSVHEWAHAITATRLGDPTPANEGRLTLNPVAHLDPMGALVFFISRGSFGWAKPVPVNPRYFAHPKRDMALVAIAGPVSNLILATITVLCMALLTKSNLLDSPSAAVLLIAKLLNASLGMNLGLMAFNLLPIAPLDGSKVLQLFIPWQYEHKYEDFLRIGPFILLFLIFFGSFLPIDIISWWVGTIAGLVLKVFEVVLGML